MKKKTIFGGAARVAQESISSSDRAAKTGFLDIFFVLFILLYTFLLPLHTAPLLAIKPLVHSGVNLVFAIVVNGINHAV